MRFFLVYLLLLKFSQGRSNIQIDQLCIRSRYMLTVYGAFNRKEIKTESIRKLSNFNFQWTKTLYQNNLKNIAFFFAPFFLHFLRAIDICHV